MIRNSQKRSTTTIVPGISLDLNPFSSELMSARRAEGWIPDKGRLIRSPFRAPFYNSDMEGQVGSETSPAIVRLFNFRYRRNNAPENKKVFFDTTGRGYLIKSGIAQPFFPGTASFSVLTQKPFVGKLGNRLFFSDGMASYVYDGRDPCQVWGLARSTTAPTVTAQNLAGSIVAATGVKGCFTWVVLDEAGNRVHESSRSNVSSFVVVGGADDAVRLDITGITPPARATHWSAYISELDGSNIYRRAATTAITTLTVDISAFPASTTPKAPIRNDPPPPSSVGCIAKNRIFIRDDSNPNRFYFSALGEVEGLLNGSGAESFPGYGSNSISDLVNSDLVPDREIRAMVEHNNVIYIFTESNGYALVGELNLLDSRSPRSLVKLQQFNEGCIGSDAIASTPYGLVWMSPTRKIWLWSGEGELIDIGAPLQPALNHLTDYSTSGSTVSGTVPSMAQSVYFMWWSGNNRQWLVISSPILPSEQTRHYFGGSGIFNFQLPTNNLPGHWFEYTGGGVPCSFDEEDGTRFLVYGLFNHEVGLIDYPASPTHLNQSFILGSTYLGSTVQNLDDSYLYTNLLSPNGDEWAVGNYVSLVHGDQYSASAGTTTAPTVRYAVDLESLDSLGNTPGISLTLDTATTANEKRAWLVPESAGNTNAGGAFGKNFSFFLIYTSTDTDTTTDASARPLSVYNTINRFSGSWTMRKDSSR